MQEKSKFNYFVDVPFSIREAFKKHTDIPFRFVEGGEELNQNTPPIYYLRETTTSFEQLSKLRESMRVTVSYEVDIIARDIMELKVMQGLIVNFIMMEDIPFLSSTTGEKIGLIDAKPSFMSLEYMKEVNRESDYNRRQLSIDVDVILNKKLGG